MTAGRVIPARILRPRGLSQFILLCDHASNHVPAAFGNLGLPETELRRHIAWDIGAAGVTERLSALLDAPAVLCGISRLVIDCNRQLHLPELIPAISDGTPVPGNVGLIDECKAARIERWFEPYHDAIESLLLERTTRGAESIVVAVHSMTPSLDGLSRPWHIALSSLGDRRLIDRLLGLLRAPGDLVVGDGEPYDIEPDIDYTIPFHAMRRGLQHLQVEFRQDEIADTAAQHHWASRFAEVALAAQH